MFEDRLQQSTLQGFFLKQKQKQKKWQVQD